MVFTLYHHLRAGMLVAGALEERTSPRTVMLITAACLGLGLIASAFTESLPFIYATLRRGWSGPAVVLAPMWSASVTLKWFPDKQGLGLRRHAHGLRRRHHAVVPRRHYDVGRARMASDLQSAGSHFRRAGGAGAFISEAADTGICSPLLLEKGAAERHRGGRRHDGVAKWCVRPRSGCSWWYLMPSSPAAVWRSLISQQCRRPWNCSCGAEQQLSGAASAGAWERAGQRRLAGAQRRAARRPRRLCWLPRPWAACRP
ncbi:MAG: hypothetical protein ACLTDR_02460 [Adlercreutzia equolifaciens]